RSLIAAADQRSADVDPPMQTARDLADRFGEPEEDHDHLGFGFGPTNVGLWEMALALECDEPDRALSIGQSIEPQRHPFTTRQSQYWLDYGRALARVRRRDDAVMALGKAEQLFPARVHRSPFARDVIAELVAHAKRNTVGRELRGMAYRAGLPV